jgi:hypothetical protein
MAKENRLEKPFKKSKHERPLLQPKNSSPPLFSFLSSTFYSSPLEKSPQSVKQKLRPVF